MSAETESVKVDRDVLATYRFLSERTGKQLSTIISDTLRACASMYLAGAQAGVQGLGEKIKLAKGDK
jgi:hypothetical protein